MSTATVARGGTSVDIDLVGQNQSPLIATDAGKPHLNIREGGGINPRFIDQYSNIEQFTLTGHLKRSSAHSDAITLADLIKEGVGDPATALTVDFPTSEFDSNIKVAPALGQEEALTLTYPRGIKDFVQVDLALTRISETAAAVDQSASTPTGSGSGPIQLSDGSTTVNFGTGIQIERSLGRPASQPFKTPAADYPKHYDKHKTAYDAFEIRMVYTQSASSTINDLRDIMKGKLGISALSLDFQGVYGLGEFKVVPQGSGALRHVERSGEDDTTIPVPTLSLRRVRDDL